MWIVQVDGRIVVDAASYFDNNNNCDSRPIFHPLSTRFAAPEIEVEDGGHRYHEGWNGTGRGRPGMPHPYPPPPPPPPPPMGHMPMMVGQPLPHRSHGGPIRPGPPIYREQPKAWQLDYAQLIPPEDQKKHTGK